MLPVGATVADVQQFSFDWRACVECVRLADASCHRS